MCQLIETIKIANRQFQNLPYHNARLNRSRKELLGIREEVNIEDWIKIPESVGNGVYRYTLTYGKEVVKIDVQPYTIRKINSLKLVANDDIDYSYKYADREELNRLLAMKQDCDEILIVKNNVITDTSFSNVICLDGNTWVTPKYPLLKGTKREKLLQNGLIKEAEISVDDLNRFQKIGLINAMLEIGDITIDIKNIL